MAKDIRETIKKLQGSKGELFDTSEMLSNADYQKDMEASLSNSSKAAQVLYKRAQEFFTQNANATLSERKAALKEFLVYKDSVQSMLDVNTSTDKKVLDSITMMEDSMKKSTSMLYKVQEGISASLKNNVTAGKGAGVGSMIGAGIGGIVGKSTLTTVLGGLIGAGIGGAAGWIGEKAINFREKDKDTKLAAAKDSFGSGGEDSNETSPLIRETNELIKSQTELIEKSRTAEERNAERNQLALEESKRESKTQNDGHEKTHGWLSKIANILNLQLAAQKLQNILTFLTSPLGIAAVGLAALAVYFKDDLVPFFKDKFVPFLTDDLVPFFKNTLLPGIGKIFDFFKENPMTSAAIAGSIVLTKLIGGLGGFELALNVAKLALTTGAGQIAIGVGAAMAAIAWAAEHENEIRAGVDKFGKEKVLENVLPDHLKPSSMEKRNSDATDSAFKANSDNRIDQINGRIEQKRASLDNLKTDLKKRGMSDDEIMNEPRVKEAGLSIQALEIEKKKINSGVSTTPSPTPGAIEFVPNSIPSSAGKISAGQQKLDATKNAGSGPPTVVNAKTMNTNNNTSNNTTVVQDAMNLYNGSFQLVV